MDQRQKQELQEDDIGQTGRHGAAERWATVPFTRAWQECLELTLEQFLFSFQGRGTSLWH